MPDGEEVNDNGTDPLDGSDDFLDVAGLYVGGWGKGCSAVPSPTGGIGMMLLGLIAVLRRRR